MPVKKILIADDSPSDRHYLSEKLAKQGYHCITPRAAPKPWPSRRASARTSS